jgi:hypothetical protein
MLWSPLDKLDIANFVFKEEKQLLRSTAIKPGPARRVDPEPGRPGGWTSSGLLKDRPVQQPGKTQSTRRVDP